MINYANYEFYKNTYKGALSNDLFNSLIPKASRVIDRSVNRELKEVDITDEVRFVACELVDFFNVNGNSISERQLSSISIDGVSKNYITKSRLEINAEKKSILNGLPHNLTRYL